MSYYNNQQQPPVGVPPPQGIFLFPPLVIFSFEVSLFLANESEFYVYLIKGIHRKTLILHQGTLHKVILHNKGTLNKAMAILHHSTLNNLLLDKKLVFLKDGMLIFLSQQPLLLLMLI